MRGPMHHSSERDNGLYEAINKGIKKASGDIIGTLNADDFYPHSKSIPIVQRVFDDPDVDACYGDLAYVDRKEHPDSAVLAIFAIP